MNWLTPSAARQRDLDFEAADEKSAHATHAERVAFADAAMAPHEPADDTDAAPSGMCCLCRRSSSVPLYEGINGLRWHLSCSED